MIALAMRLRERATDHAPSQMRAHTNAHSSVANHVLRCPRSQPNDQIGPLPPGSTTPPSRESPASVVSAAATVVVGAGVVGVSVVAGAADVLTPADPAAEVG